MTEKPFARWIGLAVGIGVACGLIVLFFLLLRPEKAYLPPSMSEGSMEAPETGTAAGVGENGSLSLSETNGTAAPSSGEESSTHKGILSGRTTSDDRTEPPSTVKTTAARKTSAGQDSTTSRRITTRQTTTTRTAATTRDWREAYEEEYAALLKNYEEALEEQREKLVSLAVDEEIELTVLAEQYKAMGLFHSGAYLVAKEAVQRKYARQRREVNEKLEEVEAAFLEDKQKLQEKYPFYSET